MIDAVQAVSDNTLERALKGVQTVEGLVKQLPFGEQAMLVAEISNPELIALNSLVVVS